nr:hypothetical protein [Tanacetum cinerariifolium]
MSPMMHEAIVAILFTKGTGHSLKKVEVKYEWVPPRCEVCKNFDHIDDECSKKPKEMATTHVEDDGFTKVTKWNGKKMQNTVKQAGIRFSKPKVYIIYKEVSKTADSGDKIINPGDKGAIPNDPNIVKPSLKEKYVDCVNESDSDVDELIMENENGTRHGMNFSPKQSEVRRVIFEYDLSVCAILESHQFTWNQKPKGADGILKKLDRVLRNFEFNDSFEGALAIFQPYRTSDHSSVVLKLPCHVKAKPKPFKFYNIITQHDRFKEVVKNGWEVHVSGFLIYNVVKKLKNLKKLFHHSSVVLKLPCHVKAKPKPFKFYNIITQHDRFKEVVKNGWEVHVSGFLMYNVVKKLKNLKKPFRKLLYENGNIHKNVDVLRVDLDRVQADLDQDPNNISLRDEEAAYVIAYSDALLLQERFLRQKAKIQWLKEGDSNSVPKAFIDHYEVFLGQHGIIQDLNIDELFGTKLDENDALNMIRNVSSSEVKEAIFSIGNDKSSGMDGYTVAFFKDAWDIVGDGIIAAVKEFFTNGRLLKELNHAVIALVPKNQNPSQVNDYRPISCCNVLFKCISKIIANRIKESLKMLISPNQSAFVPSRSIDDNILLTKELMHNYHLDHGVPRCAFKVDIQKAYDTILPFEEGSLSVKYLGVPLVSSRLVYRDCKELIEKVESRINDWKNKSLSKAGRLQLVQSVISSMHVYWSSMFILLTRVLLDIEQLMHGFLWKGRSKVAWEVVCLPKAEGGLGIKRLGVFNNALMSSNIWKLLTRKESLWVQWIHTYKLKDQNFPCRSKVAWEVVCLPKAEGGLGIKRLGVFNNALMSSNIWKLLTRKESLWVQWIHTYKLKDQNFWDIPCLTSNSKVSDLLLEGTLVWPPDLIARYPMLLSVTSPSMVGPCDQQEWRNRSGNIVPFSVNEVWNSIRPMAAKVDWFRDRVKIMAGLSNSSPSIDSIVSDILPFVNRRTTRSVISKLVVAATAYFIWQERNYRLFKKVKRSENQLVECIISSVRFKLMKCRFKKSMDGLAILRQWKLSEMVMYLLVIKRLACQSAFREQPPQGGASSTNKQKIDEDDNAVYSMPNKRHQTDPSLVKEQEVTLLKDMIDNNNTNINQYVLFDDENLEMFYNDWAKEHGVYKNMVELSNKMYKLHARFMKNKENPLYKHDVTGENDRIDIQIFRLSSAIWAKEEDKKIRRPTHHHQKTKESLFWRTC